MEISLGELIKKAQEPGGMQDAIEILQSLGSDESPSGMEKSLSKMGMELMPYQKTDALFHLLVKKSFNLSDPGLGKTAISIGYLSLLSRIKKDGYAKAIVVTPSATVFQWAGEFKKFNPSIRVFAVDGSPAKREKTYREYAGFKGDSVLVINYHKILHDSFDILQSALASDTIILDEASCLKDIKSQQHVLFKEICSAMDRALLLTATPISSSLEEFYALLELVGLDKKVALSHAQFMDNYLITRDMKVKGRGGSQFKVKKAVGSKNVELFESRVRDCYIRHENNVAAFEGLRLSIVKQPVRVTRAQASLMKKAARKLADDPGANPLASYQDFSKICMAPSIYDPCESSFSPKIEKLVEFLKENRDSKYVVYARFLSFHKLVHDRLEKEGIPFVSLTGAESSRQKEESKEQFLSKSVSDIQVILLTDAGKYGLNLQNANSIILMDIPYTPSNALQIIGRVFRTGQKDDVTAVFIYCEDTIEENQFHRLEERQSSVDQFFSTDKAGMFALGGNGRRMRKSLIEMANIKPPFAPEPDEGMAVQDDSGFIPDM